MSMKLVELKQEYNVAFQAWKAIFNKSESEKRAMTVEEDREYKRLDGDMDRLRDEILKEEVEDARQAEEARSAFKRGVYLAQRIVSVGYEQIFPPVIPVVSNPIAVATGRVVYVVYGTAERTRL